MKFIFPAAFAFCLAPAYLYASCQDILADGIRDKYNFAFDSSLAQTTKYAICNTKSRDSASSSGLNLKIPIPEIGAVLGLGSNNDSIRKSLNQFCRNGQSTVDENLATSWASSTINPNILEAWNQCKLGGGFQCDAAPLANNDFKITISWKRANVGAGTEKAVLNALPQFSNAACSQGPQLGNGTEILDDSSIERICARVQSAEPAFVVLNSSQGSATCFLPAATPPKPQETLYTTCKQGTHSSCLELAAEMSTASEECFNRSSGMQGTEKIAFERYYCGGFNASSLSIVTYSGLVNKYCSGDDMDATQCAASKMQINNIFERYSELKTTFN